MRSRGAWLLVQSLVTAFFAAARSFGTSAAVLALVALRHLRPLIRVAASCRVSLRIEIRPAAGRPRGWEESGAA